MSDRVIIVNPQVLVAVRNGPGNRIRLEVQGGLCDDESLTKIGRVMVYLSPEEAWLVARALSEKPPQPKTGDYWQDWNSRRSYRFDGKAWIEETRGEVASAPRAARSRTPPCAAPGAPLRSPDGTR